MKKLSATIKQAAGRVRIAAICSLLAAFLLPALPAGAQVNSLSDQYLVNLFLLNPAVAGTGQFGSLTVASRQQWAGWSGAPASQSITYHTKFARANDRFNPLGFINKGKNSYSKVGAGAGFFHESYGVFNLTGMHLDYSYHVFLTKGRLSFGLGPTLYHIGTSSVTMTDPGDPWLDNPVRSNFFDANAGAHYFSKTWYGGISLVQLLNGVVRFGNYGYPGTESPSLNPDLARSVYAYGGYYFTVNRSLNLKVEPMALIKLNAVDGFRFDISGTVHLRDLLSGGLSYAYKRGVSAFLGARLDNLSFRYIFEIPFTGDIPARYSSHLIQLSINIGQPLD